MHVVLLSAEYDPERHVSHWDCPFIDAKCPIGQSWHRIFPSPSANVPRSQGTHSSLLSDATVPEGHGEHMVDPSSEAVVPMGQVLHRILPASNVYVPTGHSMQVFAMMSRN